MTYCYLKINWRSVEFAEAVGWIVGAFTAAVVMGLIGYMQ